MTDSEKTNLLLSCLSVQLDLIMQISLLSNDEKHIEQDYIRELMKNASDSVLEVMAK
jgi:hypothetical protein